MGGQLDGSFLAGSLPHELIILIVTSFICLWLIIFFLSLSYHLHEFRVYNNIQYNAKFVKRHVAVASEALANRSVKKHRRRRTNVL